MQALAGLLAMAAFVAAWIVIARLGRTRGWPAFKRHGLGALSAVVALLIVTAIFAPRPTIKSSGSTGSEAAASVEGRPQKKLTEEEQAEAEKADRLQKIKQLSGGIVEVSESDSYHLAVTQVEESIWSEKAWANSATLWAPEFLKELTKAYPGRYKEVTLRFVVPTKDKYGNSSTGEAMTLTYDMSEIAKINWQGVTPYDVMNFAKTYFRPLGRQGVQEWCVDGNAKYADEFCSKAFTVMQ